MKYSYCNEFLVPVRKRGVARDIRGDFLDGREKNLRLWNCDETRRVDIPKDSIDNHAGIGGYLKESHAIWHYQAIWDLKICKHDDVSL